MVRLIERLNAMSLKRCVEPGLYPDGAGLYFQVTGAGGRSWIYRYWVSGRERQMGLGPLHTVSLAEAREAARQARRLRLQGRDPLEEKPSVRRASQLRTGPIATAPPPQTAPAGSSLTFAQAAEAFIEMNRVAWRNEKHAAQWTSTLTTYSFPHFGELSVSLVETRHVLAALEPIWAIKAETANRLRGRIEAVLDWAAANGHRSGPNPALWKGHLDKILPAKSKVRAVVHHAALPFAEVPAFFQRLAQVRGVSARALEYAILTAARTGEVIGADWSEIDLAAKVWTVPADRMKTGKAHRVPLSASALAILESARERSVKGADQQPVGLIFQGMRPGLGLSNMSLLKVLKTLKRPDLTTHGFRSSFRDWAAEMTNYSNEVVEMALSHTIASKVEAAYRRGDLLEKRRGLMEEWARACLPVLA